MKQGCGTFMIKIMRNKMLYISIILFYFLIILQSFPTGLSFFIALYLFILFKYTYLKKLIKIIYFQYVVPFFPQKILAITRRFILSFSFIIRLFLAYCLQAIHYIQKQLFSKKLLIDDC